MADSGRSGGAKACWRSRKRVAARRGRASRSRSTPRRLEEVDVRAFDGEIESLSSASTSGVGIRVVAGDRQGFAYAGALDERSDRSDARRRP